jgi:hypothetical protein
MFFSSPVKLVFCPRTFHIGCEMEDVPKCVTSHLSYFSFILGGDERLLPRPNAVQEKSGESEEDGEEENDIVNRGVAFVSWGVSESRVLLNHG